MGRPLSAPPGIRFVKESASEGEPGLAYVTVWIDADSDGVVDWTDGNGNGCWDAGEGERWTTTDSNGYYVFTSVPNGTYANVKVRAADLPAGLTQTFEVRASNPPNGNVTVVIAGGVVTTLAGAACTSCDLTVDFGYRYAGINQLSGTVCLDDASKNGFCAGATTYTGVGAGESPLGGIQVGLYRWTDTDGDKRRLEPHDGSSRLGRHVCAARHRLLPRSALPSATLTGSGGARPSGR